MRRRRRWSRYCCSLAIACILTLFLLLALSLGTRTLYGQVGHLDADEDGCVSLREFMHVFQKLGREEEAPPPVVLCTQRLLSTTSCDETPGVIQVRANFCKTSILV